MIDVKEHGRNLVFTLGDEPDPMTITVKPVNGKVGRVIFEIWLRILTGQSKDINGDTVRMGHLAVGGENVHLIEGDDVDEDGNFVDKHARPIPIEDAIQGLRFEEAEFVINASVFWQMQGGGWKTVVEYMAGGLPKAILLVMDSNGLLTSTEPSNPLPSGASVNLMPAGAFGATTTRNGSATSSNTSANRKPPTD